MGRVGEESLTFYPPAVIVEGNDAGETKSVKGPTNVPVIQLRRRNREFPKYDENRSKMILTIPGAYPFITLKMKVAMKLYNKAKDFFLAAAAPVRLLCKARMVYAVAAGVGKVNFWCTM